MKGSLFCGENVAPISWQRKVAKFCAEGPWGEK